MFKFEASQTLKRYLRVNPGLFILTINAPHEIYLNLIFLRFKNYCYGILFLTQAVLLLGHAR